MRRFRNIVDPRLAVCAIVALFSLLQPLPSNAQMFNLVYQFSGPDGQWPVSGLLALNGNFYGVTAAGGAYGQGAAFELTQSSGEWTENLIYSFKGKPDATDPDQSLIADSAGNLYGVSFGGGANDGGAVFELMPTQNGWQESILHSFAFLGTSSPNNGSYPESPLVMDRSGNLYGSTFFGGTGGCEEWCGTIYELTPSDGSWSENVIHFFNGDANGRAPSGAMVFDNAGNLYGVTQGGTDFSGSVFELSPLNGSWTITTLHSFGKGHDGGTPAGLTQDAAGNLYGATLEGGGSPGNGEIFKLMRTDYGWTYNVLYGFTTGSFGSHPSSLVTAVSANQIYGEASGTEFAPGGSVYELTPNAPEWNFTNLFTFPTSASEGDYAVGGLVFGPQGALYGTTQYGGNSSCPGGCGVVFTITP